MFITILAAPKLALIIGVLSDSYDGGGVGIVPVQRQGRADDAQHVGKEAASAVHLCADDIAFIDSALAAFDALAKSRPDGGGEGIPVFRAEEFAKANIAEVVIIDGC